VKRKKTIVVSILVIVSFLSVLGLGIYYTCTTPTLVNKCDGYGNVKFGMDIKKVKEIAQKEEIVIKNPLGTIIVNGVPFSDFIYGTFTMSGGTHGEAEVLYFYSPYTKQVYDIMIFYSWADDEYYEALLKEMKKKYGNVLGTPSGAHWWGHKQTISLGWVIRSHLGGGQVWKTRDLRALYRDKELYKAYQKQTEQERKERERKRLSIDGNKL